MIKLKDVFEEWRDRIDHPIIALETGCAFMWGEKFDPYTSSLNIVEHLVAPTNGTLYSLDIDQDRINTCKKHLAKKGLDIYVEFICGDSVESLKTLPQNHINFAWLDSSEDAYHATQEFEYMQLLFTDKHILCVDDYGSSNSVKWQEISNAIKKDYTESKTYETPTGLIVGYNE